MEREEFVSGTKDNRNIFHVPVTKKRYLQGYIRHVCWYSTEIVHSSQLRKGFNFASRCVYFS